ncbi:MAG TPA: hypothetical protein VGM10_02725 [Actinocrinis sp.]
MYFSYQLYQTGRVISRREQLEADVRAGERAKSVAGLWHLLLPPRRALVEASADESIGQSCVTAGR